MVDGAEYQQRKEKKLTKPLVTVTTAGLDQVGKQKLTKPFGLKVEFHFGLKMEFTNFEMAQLTNFEITQFKFTPLLPV